MSVKAFLSELKKFFIDSFSDPAYEDRVLYFIIEELPNPRDSGVFKILCGSTQIAGLLRMKVDIRFLFLGLG